MLLSAARIKAGHNKLAHSKVDFMIFLRCRSFLLPFNRPVGPFLKEFSINARG
jgi:hypothetical protein